MAALPPPKLWCKGTSPCQTPGRAGMMRPLLSAGFLVFSPLHSGDTEAQSKGYDACSQGLALKQGLCLEGNAPLRPPSSWLVRTPLSAPSTLPKKGSWAHTPQPAVAKHWRAVGSTRHLVLHTLSSSAQMGTWSDTQ